ncbi:MAG: thioredoxin family protein [Tenericutes bacterium]|jgi:hypothetical protein|nr:thioredoxin family protein [Mycoplasmatota bacterium]
MKYLKYFSMILLFLVLVGCSDEPEFLYEYSDYEYYDIKTFDEQLNHSQNEYYIYYYSENCGSCQYIKNDVMSRIANLEEDYLLLFDVRAGIDIHPNDFLRDEEDGLFYTPTMVYVENGEFIEKWVGIDEVLSILETLE